jgi:protein phosphatase 1 regulatory subunit 7
MSTAPAAQDSNGQQKENEQHPPQRNGGESSPGLRNSKGWDGKLRLPKNATLSNPEALSDDEYSDEENVVPGEEILADEGAHLGNPLSLEASNVDHMDP